MPHPTVLISIDTTAETEAESFGRAFIQSLCDEDTRLIPELVSLSERYKDAFLGIDDFLANWWAIPVKTTVDGEARPDSYDGPFWKRKSTLVSRGMVNHGITDLWNHRYPSTLWYECRWAKDVDFSRLFESWVSLSHSDIGMLHVFTDSERRKSPTADESSFETGSFGGPAKPGLPNMGWAMAYGEGYKAEVDAARISAAGFPVDEVDGVTIVRVTDKLNDVVDEFDRFSRRRAELKALFRPNLFWIKEEPSQRER